MKNLVNRIGTITVDDQIKMMKKVGRDLEIENGRGSFSRVHKDKKKDADKRACRNFKF